MVLPHEIAAQQNLSIKNTSGAQCHVLVGEDNSICPMWCYNTTMNQKATHTHNTVIHDLARSYILSQLTLNRVIQLE